MGDREFCTAILPAVSRTFALSIAALPESLRETVCVAYLLCRIVDTIEDDPRLEAEMREGLFEEFERLVRDDTRDARRLATCELGQDATHELVTHASSVFAVFRELPTSHREICRPPILEMAGGMRAFRNGGSVRDMADLERYCYFVAGTVGVLLTGLFELTAGATPEARARAVSFGLGLQMVNIVKDVREDQARGDCFLPAELVAADGVAGARAAVCARARTHLASAREYTLLWKDPDVRLFCAVPLALALATLREIETSGKTKISRDAVARIFDEVRNAIGDDAALEALLR